MDTEAAETGQVTRYLGRPGGRVGYDVSGEGPLVVLVPGMGDLRSTYRFLSPRLREAGYRVACTELRGHGDSDTGFASYGEEETAGDIVALVEELAQPAVIVGNSMGAGSAVLVSARRPELVAGLVLVGPFVRDAKLGPVARLALKAALARPLAAMSWGAYLPKLYAGRRPDDFEAYRAQLVASLRRPGHARAFSLTTRTSHAPAEARLADVAVPVLVVMGEKDPDFADPGAEAQFIARSTAGELVMVPDAGHYPQSQQPELTSAAVLGFLAKVCGRA
jgi:pimeloyl-ACP methyl ester carboxylesterase